MDFAPFTVITSPAFRTAVNTLITDGMYGRIPKKRGTTASTVDLARIYPPEPTN
ncbi:hypothetical protein ABT075_18655 [Streptomyces sp. NPDC002677]|uniref:hypothetical protein n=1 Tax=Streptomyces sp. NPDC002677 TaxID=3154774 RepID=UPI0033187BC1